MPSINDLKKSNFLTRHDVGRGVLVTIRGYEEVNVAKEGAPEEMRYALKFDEAEKPLVLNSTNGQIIAKITGSEDFDHWIGHKVVLYDEPNISFGGKLVGGIRVRAPRQQPAPAQQTQPAPRQAPKQASPAPVQQQAPPPEGEPPYDDSVPFNQPEAIPAHQHWDIIP